MRDFDENRYRYLRQLDPVQAEQFRDEYQNAVAVDFRNRHPDDFIPTAENARLLREEVESAVEAGMMLGPKTLDFCHQQLIERENKQQFEQANRLSNRELEARLRAAGEPIYKSTL